MPAQKAPLWLSIERRRTKNELTQEMYEDKSGKEKSAVTFLDMYGYVGWMQFCTFTVVDLYDNTNLWKADSTWIKKNYEYLHTLLTKIVR